MREKKTSRENKSFYLSYRLHQKLSHFATAEKHRIRNLAVNFSAMSSVRRKLFKEGSNSWASETIVESQNINEAVENGRTEIVEYTIVNEGDATPKEQIVENPHGLKTPQENVFRPVAPSFSDKVILS